jgi:triphosphatase
VDETARRSRSRSRRRCDRDVCRRAIDPTLAQSPQKGKGLAQLDAPSRHRLRILAKKLRYAAEFFASLFPGKQSAQRRDKFLAALERLQHGLGDLNDIAVHEDVITAMGFRCRRLDLERAFAAGVLTGREDARLDTAMAAATEAYTELASVKPFWR